MNKRHIPISSIIVLLFISALSTFAQNGKKVYADYHGVRYTRIHDGQLGRWALYANTSNSTTGKKTLCYNADIILENGLHEIASVNYPQVGMQSNLDPHYIEYQILSAKSAKIDGFFIEWGFMHHENDILLKAMQDVAKKYDFEIGVNWCDGWLYYDWITKMYPEIDNRDKKTEHYVRAYQYLIDNVLIGPTAPIVKGYPVFYLFGAGAAPEEFKHVKDQIVIPDFIKKPIVLRRWAEWGTLKNNKYQPIIQSDEIDQWIELGAIPTAWIPARVRQMDSQFPLWDHYATLDDVIEFMKPFKTEVWDKASHIYPLKSGFVTPGMDNRGCAGWGRGHFFYIPRLDGKTYEEMWKFNINSQDSLDMIFIASWSDYTEGHEIEPTIENGNRELLTTLRYASEFKNEEYDEIGLEFPKKLFQLRKQCQFLSKILSTTDFHDSKLDIAAKLVGLGEYGKATKIINDVSCSLNSLKERVDTLQITIPIKDEAIILNEADHTISVFLEKELISSLNENYYDGQLSFEYFDEGDDLLTVYSETHRHPVELFSVVSRIKKDNTMIWENAKVSVYKENIVYKDNKPSFRFHGKGEVENISLTLNIYKERL